MNKIKPLILQFVLVSLLCSNLGCIPFGYYHRLAEHQTFILRAKTPIETVLKDPSTSEEIKQKLRLVLEVRDFAMQNLGLNVGSNYLDYVPLKEEAVTFVVNAAEKYELKTYQWSYPIVGKLPYKGFPTKKEAEEEAQKMQKQYDTYVRGVSAYSTLGWFDDPIFSSMLSLSEERLVETIIHESVHATVFYKDDADFNERLATFLGQEGAKLFYKYKKQEDKIKEIELANQKQKKFNQTMNEEINILKTWYTTELSKEVDVAKKESRKKEQLKKLTEKLFKLGYIKDQSVELNNARLVLFSTYQGDSEQFIILYSKYPSFKDLILHLKTLTNSHQVLSGNIK